MHLAAVAALAAPPTPGPFDYDQVEIGPRIYGWFEKRLNSIVSGNVIAVIGDESVLVFDSGHHPLVTRRIVADLGRLTDRPVKYLVVSHWHDDHWVGNSEFADRYPGLQVIAHEFTARLMDERKEKFGGAECKAELANDSKSLRDMLASGKRPDGSPLSEASIGRVKDGLAVVDEQSAQCDVMRYVPVNRPITGKTTFELGGRTVIVDWLGRGNTAGDLVAYIPDSRVLLTGDLVVHPFPFATQSYIAEWAQVLRKLAQMDAGTIVPGHGPVLHDWLYVNDIAETLEALDRQARAAYTPGMTMDELRKRIDLSGFSEKFSHGDAFIKANFDNMIVQSAVKREWQELAGKLEPEGG
jgi:glyoxylase-like metal-dependent hydrolase (beta-lactamase superfamily II)